MHSTVLRAFDFYKITRIPAPISLSHLISLLFTMIYLAAILFFFRLISAVDLTVDLNYLKIQGINPGNGVSQWLGIPYASAPLGQYRWKAPVDYPKDYQLYRANAVSRSPSSQVR